MVFYLSVFKFIYQAIYKSPRININIDKRMPTSIRGCSSLCCTNQVNDAIYSVGALLARLVHFLLWQVAKPSGDKCTP